MLDTLDRIILFILYRMSTVFGMNYFVFCILVLIVVLYFTKSIRDEGFFGMSPGTMDQLSSTRAPNTAVSISYDPSNELSFTRQSSKLGEEVEDHIQKNLTTKGIMDMTESGYHQNDFASV